MNKEQFVIEVQKIATQSNPDLANRISESPYTFYEDVLKELTELKDKAMRWEILRSSFKPEPELFPVNDSRRASLRETQARQASMRQGQL